MKILHVLTAPRAEGTPRLVLDWLDIEVEQHVFFLQGTPDTLLPSFKKKARSVTANREPLNGKAKFLKMGISIYKICRQIQPDLLVVYPTGISQYLHAGARLAGVRRLITHAGNPPSVSGLLNRYLYSYLTFWSSWLLGVKVIACSDYVKQAFQRIRGVPKSVFFIVHNSFYPGRFLASRARETYSRAVMVATMEPHKDHMALLLAWKKVKESGKDYQLTLAGDGSLKPSLMALSEELGLMNVRFAGYVSDVPELLHQSDVFVFSTTPGEGFGTVLLEALAAGLKVVASDVPACREVLKDGEFGKLVPAEDTEALATAIIQAFENPLTTDEVKKQQEYVTQFTPQRMMAEYLKIAGFTNEEIDSNIKQQSQ